MRSLLALFLLAIWALAPDAASACAVCYGGGEESRTAFIVTTLFLSVLPVALVGGIVWVVWRRIRDFELEPRADEAAPETATRVS
ncbi:MAG: hypothetical protein AAF430_09375 [Myxococcota bacterium]